MINLKSLFYEIRNSEIDGLGLFATIDIPKCTVLDVPTNGIASFISGSTIEFLDAKSFLFQEAKKDFNFINEGFINHCSSPNLVFLYGSLITIEDIKIGDEFTLNYNTLLKEGDKIFMNDEEIIGIGELEANRYSIKLLEGDVK